MSVDNKITPVGTGMQGASTPKLTGNDIPVHIDGQPEDETTRVEKIADHAAGRANSRQSQEDPTIFTK